MVRLIYRLTEMVAAETWRFMDLVEMPMVPQVLDAAREIFDK
jgi:hypothetical protein